MPSPRLPTNRQTDRHKVNLVRQLLTGLTTLINGELVIRIRPNINKIRRPFAVPVLQQGPDASLQNPNHKQWSM